jgi:hypothetical protein
LFHRGALCPVARRDGAHAKPLTSINMGLPTACSNRGWREARPTIVCAAGKTRLSARQHAVDDPVLVDKEVHEGRADVNGDEAEQDPGQHFVQAA